MSASHLRRTVTEVTQSLDVEQLQRALANAPIRFQIRGYAQVASTQDLVALAAAAGEPEGRVVWADQQTAGRGRLGRSWTAPAGSSLMFSVLLRPAAGSACWTTLTLVAGLAVVEGLALAGGPSAQLKWPNDCICRERKLAGILAESPVPTAADRVVVLGIGCNVAWAGRDLPAGLRRTATACDLEGHPLDRTVLAEAILGRLAIRYREWTDGGFGALRQEWLRHAAWIGQRVTARHPSGPVSGRALGISKCGELIVETAEGPLALAAGEMERALGPRLRLADGVAD